VGIVQRSDVLDQPFVKIQIACVVDPVKPWGEPQQI
jgi:hypothetical protein